MLYIHEILRRLYYIIFIIYHALYGAYKRAHFALLFFYQLTGVICIESSVFYNENAVIFSHVMLRNLVYNI